MNLKLEIDFLNKNAILHLTFYLIKKVWPLINNETKLYFTDINVHLPWLHFANKTNEVLEFYLKELWTPKLIFEYYNNDWEQIIEKIDKDFTNDHFLDIGILNISKLIIDKGNNWLDICGIYLESFDFNKAQLFIDSYVEKWYNNAFLRRDFNMIKSSIQITAISKLIQKKLEKYDKKNLYIKNHDFLQSINHWIIFEEYNHEKNDYDYLAVLIYLEKEKKIYIHRIIINNNYDDLTYMIDVLDSFFENTEDIFNKWIKNNSFEWEKQIDKIDENITIVINSLEPKKVTFNGNHTVGITPWEYDLLEKFKNTKSWKWQVDLLWDKLNKLTALNKAITRFNSKSEVKMRKVPRKNLWELKRDIKETL